MKYLIAVLTISCVVIIYDNFFNQPINLEANTFEMQNNDDIVSPQAKVIKAGLFKVIRSGGLVESKNTSTGKAIAKPVIQMLKTTERIPLVKDAHMSLQYRIWNLPEQPAYIKLRRVLKHPVMSLPDGSQSSGSDYMITGKVSVGQVIAYTGYGLNEDYEMLEGEWTFQIWYKDEKLIDHTFVTYYPDEVEQEQLGDLSLTENKPRLSASNSEINEHALDGIRNKVQAAAKRNWLN